MAPKSTGTLIYQWTADNQKELRLIAVGHCTPGYEDRYVIERREPDSLGDMCWVLDTQWTANCDNPTFTMLVVALKAALRTQALATIKPRSEPGTRLLELIQRVVNTPGAISSALRASEWHELADALSVHFKPAA